MSDNNLNSSKILFWISEGTNDQIHTNELEEEEEFTAEDSSSEFFWEWDSSTSQVAQKQVDEKERDIPQGTRIIRIAPDSIVFEKKTKGLKRLLGNEFYAANWKNKQLISGFNADTGDETFLQNNKIISDSCLLVDKTVVNVEDDDTKYHAVHVLLWYFDSSTIYISLLLNSAYHNQYVLEWRQVQQTSALTATNTLNALIDGAVKGSDIEISSMIINCGIIYFGDKDAHFTEMGEALRVIHNRVNQDIKEFGFAKAYLSDPENFSTVWEQSDNWVANYKQTQISFANIPREQIVAGALACSLAAIGGTSVVSALNYKEKVDLQDKIDQQENIGAAADEQLASLSRDNIEAYISLYTIDDEKARSFSEIIFFEGMKYDINVSGNTWTATGKLPENKVETLKIRDSLLNLPENCQANMQMGSSVYDSGEVELTCVF